MTCRSSTATTCRSIGLGAGVGNFAFPFFRIEPVTGYDGYAQYWVNSQIMDSRTGTHISPPAHYGLPDGFSVADYAPDIRAWAEEFEARYGQIQSTDVTSDKVPVSQMMGPARRHQRAESVRLDQPGRLAGVACDYR